MKSPISLKEALDKINELKNEYYFRHESERVDLNDSIGRELSETIFAETGIRNSTRASPKNNL